MWKNLSACYNEYRQCKAKWNLDRLIIEAFWDFVSTSTPASIASTLDFPCKYNEEHKMSKILSVTTIYDKKSSNATEGLLYSEDDFVDNLHAVIYSHR